MFPPRTTGCEGSPARRCAASAAVVVLPFVPVTPIVGAGQRRRKRSGSDTRTGAVGSPAATRAASASSAARRRGSVVGKPGVIEGLKATSAAPAQAVAGSISGPQARVTGRPSRAAREPARASAGLPS